MSNEMKDWLLEEVEEDRLNNEFCKLHPWAQARNFQGEPISGANMMEDFLEGWRKAFGDSFVKEMDAAYATLPDDEKKDFYFVQVKEKYGRLTIYPTYYNDEISAVLSKYEDLSWETCCNCGEPTKLHTTGYITPLCQKCADKLGLNVKSDISL